MKKFLVLVFLIPALFAPLYAQGANETSEGQKDLIVFAAASLTETMDEIIPLYESEHPELNIIATYDSSGTLKTQIEQGALCDLFISAGQRQIDQLDISSDESKNPTGLDFVVSGTRTDLLENKVALAVPDGNPAMIESFSDLASRLENGNVFMAMGNSDVPVGQYTSEILTYYGLDEETLANQGLITYGSNVKEVTVQVSENSVDCGVIYQTDAYSAGLSVIDTATQEMCSPVIYPAAVINSGNATEEAKAFLEYLKSSDVMAVFESVGFSPVN